MQSLINDNHHAKHDSLAFMGMFNCSQIIIYLIKHLLGDSWMLLVHIITSFERICSEPVDSIIVPLRSLLWINLSKQFQDVGLKGLTSKRHMKIILRWMRERQKLRQICNHIGPHKQFLYTTWFTNPKIMPQKPRTDSPQQLLPATKSANYRWVNMIQDSDMFPWYLNWNAMVYMAWFSAKELLKNFLHVSWVSTIVFQC